VNNNSTDVVAFWVVAPCNVLLGNQRFEDRAASIFTAEVRDQEYVSSALLRTQRSSLITIFNREDGRNTASDTLVSNHQKTTNSNSQPLCNKSTLQPRN